MIGCRFEDEVREAALGGRWTPALSSHMTSCAPCREVRLVVEALHQAPASTRLSIDASALWMCGRHARRIRAEARVGFVVAAIEIGVLVGVLAAVVSFVDWRALWTSIASLQLTLRSDAVLFSAVGGCTVTVAAVAGWLSWARSRV